MQDRYPIVQLDRATAQEFLPILMNKGIFTNYLSLPVSEDILNSEMKRLGVEELTPQQKRDALSKVGQYRNDRYVVRDYGDYAIAFEASMFLEYLNKMETELENLPKSDSDAKIGSALKRIKLYKLAHRLVIIILSIAYMKGTYTQLEISKRSIVEFLGYTTEDKQIYQDISDAMFSLMMLTYKIFQYKSRLRLDERQKMIGMFIYNLAEDSKKFILDINPKFAGCVVNFLNDRDQNTKDLYKRGFLSYPTSIIPATKGYSTAAYLLANFLIVERGNIKLNAKGVKVVSFKIRKFMDVMNIRASRPGKRKSDFLKAIKEVKIIHDTNYSVYDLTQMPPSQLEDTTLRITVKAPAKELDSYIKSNLLGVK